MNHYAARERKSDGRWNWTRKMGSDGPIVAAGACVNHEAEGHATKEEAERCFYEHELATLQECSMDTTHEPCKVCGKLTNKLLGRSGFPDTPLCDEHRNVEEYRKLKPFTPGRFISSSY